MKFQTKQIADHAILDVTNVLVQVDVQFVNQEQEEN